MGIQLKMPQGLYLSPSRAYRLLRRTDDAIEYMCLLPMPISLYILLTILFYFISVILLLLLLSSEFCNTCLPTAPPCYAWQSTL